MANNGINVELDWKTGRGPLAMMAALEGFEAAFFNSELPKAAEDIALKLERSAKKYVAVDTGNLKASINSAAEKAASHAVKAIVGSGVEYAPAQEFGSATQSGTPYIRPAIEENRSYIKERVKEAFESAASLVGG